MNYFDLFIDSVIQVLDFVPSWVWMIFAIAFLFQPITNMVMLLLGPLGPIDIPPDPLVISDELVSTKHVEPTKEESSLGSDANEISQ